MSRFEYKIIPASVNRGKAKLLKGGAEKVAVKLESEINKLGLNGWEYYRTETYPIQKSRWFSPPKIDHISILVFRREIKRAETMPFSTPETKETHLAREHQSSRAQDALPSTQAAAGDAVQSSEPDIQNDDEKGIAEKKPDHGLAIIPRRHDT
ncbi:MAG: hypothetical protein OXD29_05105 [Roseovarius sp.]|nr:hypothetical protein [Roseovarius sp.]